MAGILVALAGVALRCTTHRSPRSLEHDRGCVRNVCNLHAVLHPASEQRAAVMLTCCRATAFSLAPVYHYNSGNNDNLQDRSTGACR